MGLMKLNRTILKMLSAKSSAKSAFHKETVNVCSHEIRCYLTKQKHNINQSWGI